MELFILVVEGYKNTTMTWYNLIGRMFDCSSQAAGI
jgi:hypothetical protein